MGKSSASPASASDIKSLAVSGLPRSTQLDGPRHRIWTIRSAEVRGVHGGYRRAFAGGLLHGGPHGPLGAAVLFNADDDSSLCAFGLLPVQHDHRTAARAATARMVELGSVTWLSRRAWVCRTTTDAVAEAASSASMPLVAALVTSMGTWCRLIRRSC